jgi:hypothetical protein
MAVLAKDYDRSLRPRPEISYVRKPAKVARCRNEEAHAHWHQNSVVGWLAKTEVEVLAARQLAGANALTTNVEVKFRKLAAEWSREVRSVSSVGAMTSHSKYREIIHLGWDVVPFLLADLQQHRGFWFTALNEITGIRPFDPSDAGKSKQMTEAWVQWGKRKGII